MKIRNDFNKSFQLWENSFIDSMEHTPSKMDAALWGVKWVCEKAGVVCCKNKCRVHHAFLNTSKQLFGAK